MEKTVIRKIENQIRQQLFGTLMLIVAGLMLINSFGLMVYANDLTNLTFNVTAGSFSVTNAPEGIVFASQAFGVGNNMTGDPELDGTTIIDQRGNHQEWTVSVNANNFLAGAENELTIVNKLHIYQNNSQAVLTNVGAFDTNHAAIGPNGSLNGSGVTLVNGSTQASGVVQYDNGFLNLTVGGTDAQGNYTAVMHLTIV